MTHPLARRLLAEYLGSAFLAAVVIGSGIAASQLSPDDTGLALLENAAATAAGLFAIILMFGPVSGGHFNPVVSLVDAHFGGLSLARRARLHPCPDRRLHHRRGRGQRHVRAERDQHLHHPPRECRASVRRGDRDARSAPRHLRARPHGPRDERPGRCRRLHRCRLLVHELHELRQSRHHGGPDVLGHLRRDRAGVRPWIRRLLSWSAACSRS